MTKSLLDYLERKQKVLSKISKLFEEENIEPRLQLELTNEYAEALRQTIIISLLDKLGIITLEQSSDNLQEAIKGLKKGEEE